MNLGHLRSALIRQMWFRITVVTLVVLGIAAIFPEQQSTDFRKSLAGAYQATLVVFSICFALALALVNNYVKGLREAASKRISDIRSMIEKVYDEMKSSKDEDAMKVVKHFLIPAMSADAKEWHDHMAIQPIWDRLYEPLQSLHARYPNYVPRHFLRLEDEYNELGLLLIRRILIPIHTAAINGALLLLATAIAGIFVVALMPYSLQGNLIASLISASMGALAVLELWLLAAALNQEAEEEGPQYLFDQSRDIDAGADSPTRETRSAHEIGHLRDG